MNSFRILLVEENSRRADDILSEAEKNQILAAVSTIAEAEEVLSIEKFDAILFREQPSVVELAAFAGRLRKAENGITDRCRTVILVCENGNDVALADGSLPCDFTLDELYRTVSQALERQMRQAGSAGSATPQPSGFDPAEFAAQCANDVDLMIEIINLFLEECKIELPEMGDALGRRDFEALSRLAHRMKGSLGSLHAPVARQRAQALESASKSEDHGVCSALLQALEHDLTALKTPLETLRDSCLRA
jgi:HPt (histidine-containing phosphotransfer) domain-containing protein